jgi:hypothetical protein
MEITTHNDCQTTLAVVRSVNSKLTTFNAARSRVIAAKEKRSERNSLRHKILHENTILVSRERMKNTRLPRGYYTRTQILREHREGDLWQIVGQTSQRGEPLYDIFLSRNIVVDH